LESSRRISYSRVILTVLLIDSNKYFGGFSNLGLSKISLNIQIQTKAVNEGLIKWFGKRFQNKIWIFLKSETNLGPRNKNMYAMKCNLSNYSKKILLLI
jgi:hypothetical protein